MFAADLQAVNFLSKFPGLKLSQWEQVGSVCPHRSLENDDLPSWESPALHANRRPAPAPNPTSQVERTGVHILHRVFLQAAISPLSPLRGRTVRDVDFRKKYSAAVVAVHRQDQRVAQKVKDLRLEAGDVLLLSASTEWAGEHKNDEAFVLTAEVPDSSPHKTNRMWLALFLTTSMVLTQIVGGLMEMSGDGMIHLWPCATLTAGLMLLTGCFNADQFNKSLLWHVYLTIAAAFGVSTAMENTGVASVIANSFINLGRQYEGDTPVLVAIYVATALLSELLTNNAAGLIMYPIVSGPALPSSVPSCDDPGPRERAHRDPDLVAVSC